MLVLVAGGEAAADLDLELASNFCFLSCVQMIWSLFSTSTCADSWISPAVIGLPC
jgi:hypothetical protein